MSSILSYLPLLACPIGMGLMMKFMPGMHGGGHTRSQTSSSSGNDHGDVAMHGAYPEALQNEATTLASRRAAIVAELQSLGETPVDAVPGGKASCCGGGRAPRKVASAVGKQ